MLDQLIRDTFDQMADADQPPARVSVAQAMRRAQVQRRRHRLTAAGAPIFAAGAALAIAFSGALMSGGTGASPAGSHSQLPPQRFNPLVSYASATWLPYRAGLVTSFGYPTAFQLIFIAPGHSWTNIWVYAADQCVLTSSRLSCGSTAGETRGVMTVSGRAPDVGRHAAYWISHVTGDMDIPPGVTMVAFRYAPLGWAVVESTGTRADVIRIAANLRYGQTSRLRLPFRLTDLPPSWRDLRYVQFDKPTSSLLTLGSGQANVFNLPDSLNLRVSVGKEPALACNPHKPQPDCRVMTIDGVKVFLTTLAAVDGQPVDYQLSVPSDDGLSLEVDISGPHPPLSPVEFFAHHLKLLGPNPADWTTDVVG